MSNNPEISIYARLKAHAGQDAVVLLQQVLIERREEYRDQLEKNENPEIRGKAKECRDLLAIFS
jgi:hypothetical protein